LKELEENGGENIMRNIENNSNNNISKSEKEREESMKLLREFKLF
jgi:hypothetical protein